MEVPLLKWYPYLLLSSKTLKGLSVMQNSRGDRASPLDTTLNGDICNVTGVDRLCCPRMRHGLFEEGDKLGVDQK